MNCSTLNLSLGFDQQQRGRWRPRWIPEALEGRVGNAVNVSPVNHGWSRRSAHVGQSTAASALEGTEQRHAFAPGPDSSACRFNSPALFATKAIAEQLSGASGMGCYGPTLGYWLLGKTGATCLESLGTLHVFVTKFVSAQCTGDS